MRIGVASKLLLVIALPISGCAASSPSSPSTLPYLPRLDSPGVSLLAFLPPDADAVIEVDVKRLRQNPVVGSFVESLLGLGKSSGKVSGGLVELVSDADVLVGAAYGLGSNDAATLVVLRGEKFRGAALGATNATLVDDTTIVIGPEDLRKKSRKMVLANDDGMFADRAFLKARDAAVPDGAPGAVIRLTARLTPRTRVAAAGRLHLDQVPSVASVWFDVADDAALVAHLVVDDSDSAKKTAQAVRLAHAGWIKAWLPPGQLNVTSAPHAVRVVWVVGPKRLAAWAAAFATRAGGE